MKLLIFNGSQGRYIEGVTVRFGGIKNNDEVTSFFTNGPHCRAEIASLSYDANHRSKPTNLFPRITYERIDSNIVINCSSLTVVGPDLGLTKASPP